MSTSRLDRRSLLQSAAALSLPIIVPAHVLGAQGEAPSEQVRLGFIGVKNRGMQNLRPLIKNAVAVCDVDATVMSAARDAVEKSTGRKCAVYADYRKLLESKEIDAVVISSPDHWHALQTIHACEAGKDVYCEKPLTLTISEGQAMVKAARRYGRMVQNGSQQRSGPEFAAAVELVRSGKLGKLKRVRVGIPSVNFKADVVPDSEPPAELDYEMWLGPAPKRPYNVNRVHYNFRFFWDYSGGQMTNWGAHHLDIAQWALGMDDSGPVAVEGKANYKAGAYYEVPETFSLLYTYADGTTLECGCGPGFKTGTTFEGEAGTLFVNRGTLQGTPADLLPADLPKFAGDTTGLHHRRWLESIKTRKLPNADVAIAHRTATVCHLGNIALRTGRKVTWDPKAEKVIGDSEQARMADKPYRAPWKLARG